MSIVRLASQLKALNDSRPVEWYTNKVKVELAHDGNLVISQDSRTVVISMTDIPLLYKYIKAYWDIT